MRTSSVLALTVALFSLPASKALALGRDLPKDYLERHGQLVKGQKPVHGFMVNWTDTFFYAGETAEFNRFVEAYGKRNDLKLRVVLRVGPKKARSPWDQTDRDLPVEWSYYIWNAGTPNPQNPAPSQVDLWLGGRIKLDELRIPESVEVVSGGEIEKFVAERKKK